MNTIKYDPRITPDFVMECAKLGMVSVLSSQVTITTKRDLNLVNLVIPSCFSIEWIGHDGNLIQLTLKLKNEMKP